MNPGRELDALIAEKVMGLKRSYIRLVETSDGQIMNAEVWGQGTYVMPYSTDIAAAWGVIEEMQKQGFIMWVGPIKGGYGVWGENKYLEDNPGPLMASSSTQPHAICLAALKAVGHE